MYKWKDRLRDGQGGHINSPGWLKAQPVMFNDLI